MNNKVLKRRNLLASAVAAASATIISVPVSFADETKTLEAILVEGTGVVNPYAEEGAPLKAKKTSDSRRTRDIADTPATQIVLTKEYIADSGKTDLIDLLAAQPSITLGTGEGGNSFGDRYIIRGYEAANDTFNDGIREPGLISRDTFAVEQVEITKGPSGTFAGRGSSGGSVNSVTKKANQDEEFSIVELGLGTDNYKRVGADINRWIGDDTAVRINLSKHEASVPGQEPAGDDRKGAAIALAHQVNDDLKFDLDLYHLTADDIMVVPGAQFTEANGNVRYIEIPYAFSGVYNTGIQTEQCTVSVGRGQTCAGQGGTTFVGDATIDYDGSGFNDDRANDFRKTEVNTATLTVDYNINDTTYIENKTRIGQSEHSYDVTFWKGRSDSKTRAQRNKMKANQTNLIMERGDHTILAGAEFSNEYYDLFTSSDLLEAGNVIDITTQAAYVMDTIKLSEQTEVFAGLRFDNFDYSIWSAESTRGGVTTPENTKHSEQSSWNYHLGGTYAISDTQKLYAAFGTSTNFSGEIIEAGASAGYGGFAGDIEPEQTQNIEIGSKWNLMDERLLATAALFQVTKDNVAESPAGYSQDTVSTTTGENRVRGLELGLSGNLTDKLSVHAGIAITDSEILDSATPENIGKQKANFAKNSASVMLTYAATDAFKFGGTLTGSDGLTVGDPDTGADEAVTPGYGFVDLHGSYEIAPNLTLSTVVGNVFDKDYVTARYARGGIVMMGEGRTAKVNLKYKF